MIDVMLLNNFCLQGPLTDDQANELRSELELIGCNQIAGCNFTKEKYFYIRKSIFRGGYFLCYTDFPPSNYTIRNFDEFRIPEENMDFSWEEICELLGVDSDGSKP